MEVVILFLIIGLILVFGLHVLFYRKKRLTEKDSKLVRQHWAEIEAMSNDHPEQAIMKADKLLDFVLKKSGFRGTMAQKMKEAKAVFRDNDGIWAAHKLRNRIAHEIEHHVTSKKAQHALKSFRKALIDLGISL